MKKYINLAAVLFAMSICAAPLWAQMEGSIKGVVKGQDGKPVAGATIQLYDSQTGRRYSVKTNAKGEYRSIGVNMGTYKATLIVNGNTVDEKNSVGIGVGQEQLVDWDLAKDLGGGGMTDEQRKQMEAAEKANEKVKGLNASLTQAKELEGAGNYEQAITVLQQAIQVDANQDLLWAYLGDAQRGAKKYQDAIESYQKALAIKANYGPYMGQLADAYGKAGQVDKATQEYAAAVQADPTNAAAYYYNEGVLFNNVGKPDDAIATFDKSIQLDPSRADAYYWKGVNLLNKATTKDNKMTAPPGTAEAFNKYLELQPTGKYADAAKQLLATIGAPVETTFGKAKSSTPAKKKPNQ